MNIKKLIILLCLFIIALTACEKDNDQDNMIYNNPKSRVKRIIGENKLWGKYELEFNYRPDGRLDKVWRFDGEENQSAVDTFGYFTVEYDIDYHKFQIYDYVLNIDADSVKVLQDLYPATYEDTLRDRRVSRLFYSTIWEDNHFITKTYRPRRNNGTGSMFNTSYVNVSSQTQIPEISPEGNVVVIRSMEDIYGNGGYNNEYTRTIYKYEFTYEGKNMVSAVCCKPDSFDETSWSKLEDFTFSYYLSFLTGADNNHYKMRRSGNKVVIAEPGKNITYTLNDIGLAIEMITTDGDTAKIEYEEGYGNFSELYATPLERTLGKVWIK